MPGQLVLGIDGGQTSTLAALCDETGRLLGVGHAGPCDHIHEPGGPARLEKALGESVRSAFACASLPVGPLEAACCGLTGEGAGLAARLWPADARAKHLVAVHDSVAAHAGALAGGPGVIVIAGTGSVALAIDAAGRQARAGGWSHIMGDEGSAYDIGRQALVAAARACDGRGPATSLLEAVLHHLGRASLWQVHAAVHAGEIDRSGIAQLARLVLAESAAGDAVARGIVERGADELAIAAAAALRRLGMLEAPAAVSPVGGLFRGASALWEPFARRLLVHAPLAEVCAPLYPPVLGAVVLALRAAALPIAESTRRRLDAAGRLLSQEK